MLNLDRMRKWRGGIEDLAREIDRWSDLLGLAEDGVQANPRLIRDYTSRGIVSRPERDGKSASYGFEHLVEFLAARALVRDGWPLQKIAEEFAVSSPEEIYSLLPDHGGSAPRSGRMEDKSDNAALASIRTIRARTDRKPDPSQSLADPAQTTSVSRTFGDNLRRRTQMRSELQNIRDRFGAKPSTGRPVAVTRFEIAPGIDLHIETRRFKRLFRNDVEAIGRATTAHLLDALIKSGDDDDKD